MFQIGGDEMYDDYMTTEELANFIGVSKSLGAVGKLKVYDRNSK